MGALEAKPASPVEGLAPPQGPVDEAPPAGAPGQGAGVLPDAAALSGSVFFIGRSFLVFGGAFLIRALTDRGQLPGGAGVALGVAFACFWVGFAFWEARKGKRLGATFLGGTAALIGFPLVVETATRLKVLSAPVATTVLAGFAALLLLTGAVHKLRIMTWVAVLGCLGAASVLLRGADAPAALSGVLLGLAAATLVLADRFGWTGLRWPAALVLDGVALKRVFAVVALPEAERGGQLTPALAVALAAVLLYVGALFHRVVLQRRPAGGFEVIQTLLAVAVGVATAARAGALAETVPLAAGVGALAVAVGALVACVRLAEQEDRAFDSSVFGAFGFVLVLSGGLLLTRGPLLGVLWGGMALGAAFLGRRLHPAMLWAFSFILAWAAAAGSGLFAAIRDGLWAKVDQSWAAWTVPAVGTLALVLGAWAVMTVRATVKDRLPRAFSGGVLLLGVASLCGAAGYGARALLGQDAPDVPQVVLARTLVLVATALLVALARRVCAMPEVAWVAWATAATGAAKLLVQDLPTGHAATLFIAFLALGGTFIGLPRLLRTAAPATPADAAPKPP